MNLLHFVTASLVFFFTQAVFRCPVLEKQTSCTCHEIVWWNNERMSIVNCSFANLKMMPNLSSLSKQNVTRLLLNGNDISSLSISDFDVWNIMELDLSRNTLQTESIGTLSHLAGELTKLNLARNRIAINEGLMFIKNLSILTELVLDSNMILNYQTDSQILPNDIFRDLWLQSLRKLSLRSCGITAIGPRAFIGLESIRELDLTYNYLEKVPTAILLLQNLQRLFLGGNDIITIEANSFITLMHLEEIILNYNELSSIDAGAFIGLEGSLKELELYSNYLSQIPTAALRPLRKLLFLKISKNNIRTIEHAFHGEYALNMLELDSNPLEFSEDTFQGLEHSLETLFLRDTGVSGIPVAALSPLKMLSYLDISHNHFSSKTFDTDLSVLSVQTLVMSNNSLQNISSSAFSRLQNPIGLDLDNNNLSDISFIVSAPLCSFRYVDVSGNPIECDCKIEGILHSGTIFGMGLTGSCWLNNTVYELGSTRLAAQLNTFCNRTERSVRCPGTFDTNSSLQSNTGLSLINVWVLFVCSLLQKCWK
ncbi:insulin-like growth factor-binding protein complex acid labile subunit [Saccostrea echinata]|uniref:insulin-like growth factor-binding protein complex acid labile subunit n=1 Tax=Saccostrea echinata TaxID=191078 RepID=UPI002A815BB6|nr:insulin-like growth factor-binding protein complex acid labile subunit [Saccostrea echinata]